MPWRSSSASMPRLGSSRSDDDRPRVRESVEERGVVTSGLEVDVARAVPRPLLQAEGALSAAFSRVSLAIFMEFWRAACRSSTALPPGLFFATVRGEACDVETRRVPRHRPIEKSRGRPVPRGGARAVAARRYQRFVDLVPYVGRCRTPPFDGRKSSPTAAVERSCLNRPLEYNSTHSSTSVRPRARGGCSR